jgi:hypothetical protein
LLLSFPLIVQCFHQYHQFYLGKFLGIFVVKTALIVQDNLRDAFDGFPVGLPVGFDAAEDSFG